MIIINLCRQSSNKFSILNMLNLSAGILKSSSPPKFDAEVATTFTFIFNVNDYLHTCADKILIINVVDINEHPIFTTSYYTINIDEETVRIYNYQYMLSY